MWKFILAFWLCFSCSAQVFSPELIGAVSPTSAFTPSSIPSILLWLQADSLSGNPNGTAIPLWPDISGRNNHFTNETAARQPYITNNVINGHSAVRFPGQNIDFRWLSNSTGFATGATQAEMFVVLRSMVQVAAANVDTPWDFKKAGANHSSHPNSVGTAQEQFGLISTGGGGAGTGINLTNNYSSVAIFTNFHIWNTSVVTNEYIVRYNGDIVAGNDFYTNTAVGFSNQLSIGRDVDNVSTWNGEIAEFLMFSNVLTTVQRANMYAYLSNRYNIAYTNQSLQFAPTNLPGIKAWWVASDIATNDGAVVTNWVDRVSGIAATNRSGTTIPMYRSTGVNGLPGLQFLGTASNQTMKITAAISLTNYCGIHIGTWTNTSNPWSGSAGTYQWAVRPSDTWEFINPSQVIRTMPHPTNQVTMDSWTRTGSTLNMMQNTSNSLAVTLAPVAIVDQFVPPVAVVGRSSDGIVAEFIFYEQYVTPEKLTKLYYLYSRPTYHLP